MDYTIKYGDTLRMIAQRELGDAELWTNIADLNNLSYPYISATPGTGVVTAGDVINLPIVQDLTITQIPTLGTDLFLSTDKVNISYGYGGDFSVGVNGDYDLVAELDCLQQDLAHRMMTPLGTVPYHPEYGSDLTTMIGSKKDSNWKIKSQLEISSTVQCDPRVTAVNNIVVTDIPTGIKLDYDVSSKGIILTAGGVNNDEEI